MVHQKEDMVLKIQNKIREDVNNPELWAQLGDAYMQNDEFDHALIAYSNAEKISGTTPAILGLKRPHFIIKQVKTSHRKSSK